MLGLGELSRTEEGLLLRGLLGMLVKRRTADADLLEFRQESVQQFLARYTVGVTKDDAAGLYMIYVGRKEDGGMGICTGGSTT